MSKSYRPQRKNEDYFYFCERILRVSGKREIYCLRTIKTCQTLLADTGFRGSDFRHLIENAVENDVDLAVMKAFTTLGNNLTSTFMMLRAIQFLERDVELAMTNLRAIAHEEGADPRLTRIANSFPSMTSIRKSLEYEKHFLRNAAAMFVFSEERSPCVEMILDEHPVCCEFSAGAERCIDCTEYYRAQPLFKMCGLLPGLRAAFERARFAPEVMGRMRESFGKLVRIRK